jgi:mono/diheme cytochrome c family protein
MNIRLILLIVNITLFFAACEKENETKISSHNSNESHNTSQNCMNCHKSGGKGEGWFNVAGSVYKTDLISIYPNADVKLSSEPQGAGTIFNTIEVDRNGNFYTTESVNFDGGLYVSVIGTNGEEVFMDSKITHGKCNSCHGSSTEKIWIE